LTALLVSLGAGVARWNFESRSHQAKSINMQLLAARSAFSEITRAMSLRKADPALAAQVEATQAGLNSAQVALGLLRGMTVDGAQPVVGEMMRAFSRAASDGLWLSGFTVAEGGRQLEIRGGMTDQALLPPYLRRLESETVFQGRRFSALDMKGGEWRTPVEPSVAVDLAKATEKKPERWFIEFSLRTTDLPKSLPETGSAR
jgi:hypothetical protein